MICTKQQIEWMVTCWKTESVFCLFVFETFQISKTLSNSKSAWEKCWEKKIRVYFCIVELKGPTHQFIHIIHSISLQFRLKFNWNWGSSNDAMSSLTFGLIIIAIDWTTKQLNQIATMPIVSKAPFGFCHNFWVVVTLSWRLLNLKAIVWYDKRHQIYQRAWTSLNVNWQFWHWCYHHLSRI